MIMGVEVNGFDQGDLPITGEVSLIAARFCIAQGMRVDESYVTAGAGADYAGRVIFSTLRQMGILPESGIDQELFKRTANDVMRRSNVPSSSAE